MRNTHIELYLEEQTVLDDDLSEKVFEHFDDGTPYTDPGAGCVIVDFEMPDDPALQDEYVEDVKKRARHCGLGAHRVDVIDNEPNPYDPDSGWL